MQLISKFNRGFRLLLCVIDIYSKHAWAIPLKDKKGITINKAFPKILQESNRKPNKIWIDKGSEFYNTSIKSWVEKSDIEMYSTHNEGKSVIAEGFIRTLKNKIYEYVTSISKNVYIVKLDDIFNKYNNAYHNTIKLKAVDVKSNPYTDSSKKINNRDIKFKVDDIVIMSKYKNIFAKGYVPSWSGEVYAIKKVKNTVPWTYVINYFNGKEIVGTFYGNELQKTSQKEFRIEKVIKTKSDKLHVKWKAYNSSFNTWIDQKVIVWMSEYFRKPNSLGANSKVELGLPNYATKTDLKKCKRSWYIIFCY